MWVTSRARNSSGSPVSAPAVGPLALSDVDRVYQDCLAEGLGVTYPPTNHEWNAREMHVRHPDGHVFRIGQGIEEDEE